MKQSKDDIIRSLELTPHVEGGFFRRTYESKQSFGNVDNESRFLSTSIYYLLTEDSPIGHLHLNKSDIVHYFHLGCPITYTLIAPTGKLSTHVLGSNLAESHELQFVVPGGTWKASSIRGEFALISESVSPGFNYSDMCIANAIDIKSKFPQHWDDIKHLCR